MSAVSEWIAREYFESLGYLVSQPRKYAVPGRQRKAEEELDLVIYNPAVTEESLPSHITWATTDLQNVGRAVVGIRGWHTERFSAATFEQTPEILRFAETESVKKASKRMGTGSLAKILCLPDLPASGELKRKTVAMLKEKGIDGVISFRTMLMELVRHVDVKKNYDKSDLLQIIRILKNYDLLKDGQLELFGKKRKKRKLKTDQ